ncbi:MAG: helix-turn-helix transcriptional regulator [Aquabacterium commune]|uniref:helix-turn-helix transcriptional regulator n=1 Tax=Aquabacterium TaxID=92793 RepID=UPI001D7A319A|nr:helix-turn-helix transcriptional regulator [Aquabacterium sp.]MBT9609564.1 helix-turn-helix transcriptional regulator [Aquabacterium sp.]
MANNTTFDQLIAHFYKSATGEQPWGVALECLRVAMGAQMVNLYGLVKSSRSVELSFEVGDIAPQAALDFIRRYHHIEPRALLFVNESVGHVVSCDRHFSDAFVAADPFFQEFLIPYGLRYATAIKAYEDDHKVVFCGVHRGVGRAPLSDDEEAMVRRLGAHLVQALAMYFKLQAQSGPAFIGIETLNRLPYPMLLVDETRRLVFKNDLARELMASSELVHSYQGLLCGPDAQGDAQLLLALRSLGLSAGAYLGQATTPVSDKAFVRLQNSKGQWLGLHCHALRPAESMGAFGAKDLALVLLHEPGALAEPDPFVVASMWDLSPAEAQVMVGLGRGLTPQDMAAQRGVSLATIRSQIQATMVKTGASRQAELVSLLSNMPPSFGVSRDGGRT